MSLESDLVTTLLAVCPRVHPSSAPLDSPRPFVTWDHLGGDPLRYMEGTAASKRMAQIQVNVWADTKAQAVSLMLAAEYALCGAVAFTASPVAALQGDFDHDAQVYRSLQEFTVLGVR